jgi:hypothetical protein
MNDLTTQQLIIIGAIFAIGAILGFLLKPSGAKYRRLYETEHEAHMRLRADHDRLLDTRATTPTSSTERQTLRTGSF